MSRPSPGGVGRGSRSEVMDSEGVDGSHGEAKMKAEDEQGPVEEMSGVEGRKQEGGLKSVARGRGEIDNHDSCTVQRETTSVPPIGRPSCLNTVLSRVRYYYWALGTDCAG